MNLYKYRVIEHYPNGEKWTHYFISKQNAEWAKEDMLEAHPGRTYDVEPIKGD